AYSIKNFNTKGNNPEKPSPPTPDLLDSLFESGDLTRRTLPPPWNPHPREMQGSISSPPSPTAEAVGYDNRSLLHRLD
ncbi:hypothetical protein J7M28_04365, partial [bacterium]|nr:hypothetical protein [bacterium]